MLGNDTVEILGPCRPAKHTLWVLVTGLVAQHRGLAGRVGARGMPWVVAPRHHMAFQGGLEGGGGVALLEVVLESWHIWTIIVTSALSMLCSHPELTVYSNNWIISSRLLTPTHNSITHFTFDFATLNLENTTLPLQCGYANSVGMEEDSSAYRAASIIS